MSPPPINPFLDNHPTRHTLCGGYIWIIGVLGMEITNHHIKINND